MSELIPSTDPLANTTRVEEHEPPQEQSEAEAPLTARRLVKEIRARGGRLIRFREFAVAALGKDPELRSWLLSLGAKEFGTYHRERDNPDSREWDIYVHTIAVEGDETVWEVLR